MSKDYVIRVHDDPCLIDGKAWNRLLSQQAAPTPFMQHEYLSALHEGNCATEGTGWLPRFLTVEDHGELVAACPVYLKDHSYGEYVFDWAWADAYQRHGLNYYPKLLNAVPFTPVPGSRLLARDDTLRSVLLQGMTRLAADAKLSSVHSLFIDDAEYGLITGTGRSGWMMRSTVQFHWQNQDPGYPDFAAFLASLQREKRKKIAQERRRVADAGVSFSQQVGQDITPQDWDFFYRCYALTYRAHHSTPYLTRDFFARMADSMADNWLLFTAWRGGQRLATSLVALQCDRGVAYGRYWGAIEAVPCLHFEACYYQPLAWCIANGYKRFEGGAQGEHKMARGLLPVQTHSAHWLAHPQFSQAVGDFLAREGSGIANYMDELNERAPYKLTHPQSA